MGEQTMRPLTVKQIKNCDIPQDDTYRIDNADVTQVRKKRKMRSHYSLFPKQGYFCRCHSFHSRISYELYILD